MRDSTNQPSCSVPGQLSVRIECDDIADSLDYREVSDLDRKAVISAPHQVVQVQQLTALPLPAHPASFRRIEDTVAVEEIKRT